MRLLAGLAIAFTAVGTASVAAPGDDYAQRLRGAAFVSESIPPDLAPRTRDEDVSNLIDREVYRDGAPVRWRTDNFKLNARDTLRVSVGGTLQTPGNLVVDPKRAQFEADAYDVALTRDFGGVKFEAGKYDLHLAPHAGLGVTNAGGQAEAGATLTVGQRRDDMVKSQLSDLGVQDGAAFGDQGRWYLFAAASGRAVGLNMLRSEGDWDRAGWSTDAASTLVGDAQVGVGFRKGVMQTSLGVIHREVKGQHRIWGQETKQDSMVAFSFAIRPR